MTLANRTKILSIDLEDWHQAYRIRFGADPPTVSPHLERQVDRLLELLDRAGVRATFFCLGLTAAQRPDLLRAIADRGHEMQAHGHGHRRVYDLDPRRFAEDLRKAKQSIEDIVGAEVVGYRAPEFSIVPRSAWALETLAREGFRFDSSVYPVAGRRYGWPGFSRLPLEIEFPGGERLVEFPICTSRMGRAVLPLGGGGYFRLFPYAAISFLRRISRLHTEVFYFHPYEFGNAFLRAREAVPALSSGRTLRINLVQNLKRRTVYRKVERLLAEGGFCTFGEYLERKKPEGTVLFSSISG